MPEPTEPAAPADALAPLRPTLELLVSRARSERPVAEELLALWLANRSERTLHEYLGDLPAFALHLGLLGADGKPHPLWAVDELLAHGRDGAKRSLLAWRAAMLTSPPQAGARGRTRLSPATVNRRLAAVHSFLRLADDLGAIDWGAAVRIPGVKRQALRDTRGPGDAGFRRMLLAARKQDPAKAARDVAILRLFHDLALRRGELLGLRREHLELDADRPASLSVKRKGKAETTRLTLPTSTAAALRGWLEVRGDHAGALWTNFDRRAGSPQPLTSEGLYHLVKWLGAKAGVKTRPHGLRHLSITKALALAGKRGRSIEEVLPHSGHAAGSLHLLLVYRDQHEDRAGEVAGWVADAEPTPLP